MSKIIDFQCTYANSVGIKKEAVKGLDLEFPQAYKTCQGMVQLALALKKYDKTEFCELPFCHTVEGEAMGGDVNYGDENAGPRGNDYICTTAEEVLNLPEIDYSQGRIAEVLKACKYLREQGEDVVLYISGPFTILNMLMDPRYIFKIFKKKPEQMKLIFDKLQGEILRYVEEAQKAGVTMLGYSDSIGGLNILGPELAEKTVELFTYPFFKKVETILGKETLLQLCPKTTFALLGMEKAVWRDIDLGAPVKYTAACQKVVGKTKFVGQMCIKNREFVLENGIIKSIELL
ncbi:methylcobalamin:coenzyme M methyltransferase [Sporomusa ovata DSM 2662]|uniref:Methylcobalamin:coenzyme M methyltransferase, methanol-specific n=1 Tax=Sporomusa ovata TaxID=2378 RepID=A0A0U1L246_9FIRM|nr:uroporphyrinogen decarboxylase family protein [Sporomusa ovata]EQB25174.1 uroporphyrinogen-III decarboxylase [Sporomusa ovata DSM 2662]CQR73732.1 Methylcobalamin:coenzyme M methyltransferase, methanol-specific [Sporomusa ovata]